MAASLSTWVENGPHHPGTPYTGLPRQGCSGGAHSRPRGYLVKPRGPPTSATSPRISGDNSGSFTLSEALDVIFSAAQHSNAAITEMVSSPALGVESAGIPWGPVTADLPSQPPSAHPGLCIHSSPHPAHGACQLWPSLSHPVPARTRPAFQKGVGPAHPWLRMHLRPQERLQDLWEVYQRLGLEDDIVDPSNTLLREGPVLKISFRRSDPMERYLFLVGRCGGPFRLGREVMGCTAQVLPAQCLPGTAGRTGNSLLLCPSLLCHVDDFGQSRSQRFLTNRFPRHALGSNRVSI